MNEYDIIKIYNQMEKELIASMKRNLKRHQKEEEKVGFKFSQWQADKLKSLRQYRHENRTIINTYTKGLNKGVTRLLDESYKDGKRSAYDEYIEAKEDGYELDVEISDSFFQTNSRKANTMIKVINNDLKKANNACLRRSNDIYREVIHKASTFVSNGVYTERQAVDMAIKEFASKGVNCIVYKNGARHTISDYAGMAVRTANQRAQLMGEGDFRKEIGETLVIMSKHGTACEICQQFEGKVFIDDVYSGGTKKDGNYPLLSEAMKQGMFHPNCRHGLNTYYEGITDAEPQKDEAIKEPAKEELVKTSFVPAKTVAEAKRYMTKFAESVNLRGITNLENLNMVNETLEELTTKYPTRKLREIKSFSSRTTGATARYDQLKLEKRYFNSEPTKPKSVEEYRKEKQNIIDRMTKLIEQYNDGTAKNASYIRKITKWKREAEEAIKYTRFTASGGIPRKTIIHEYGHVIADQYIGQFNKARANGFYYSKPIQDANRKVYEVFIRAKAYGDVYSISQYASSSVEEFFAEVFVMYNEEKEKLPKYIIEMVEEVLGFVTTAVY